MDPLRLIGRFRVDLRGAIAIVGALTMAGSIAVTAIAVDVGNVYLSRRTAQGALDLAAIAAARDLDRAEAAARATLAANGIVAIDRLAVTPGRYVADPSLAPAARFTPGAVPANAVRLDLDSRAPLYFGRAVTGAADIEHSTRSIATTTEFASFSIGSRLISLDGGIANVLLGGLLGSGVSLTAMDYNALAALDVDLFSFSQALSTALDLDVATYGEALAAEATFGDVLSALILVARGEGGDAAELALSRLASQVGAAGHPVSLPGLVDLGPYATLSLGGASAAGDIAVSALDMVAMAAQIANGDRHVDLALGAAVPGLLNLSVRLAIGERPRGSGWIAVGAEGATVTTAQTRLRLVAEVGGNGLLSGATLRVPLHIDVAAATASLSGISCGADPARDAEVTVAVRPSAARLWVGDPRDEARFWSFADADPVLDPARIAEVPLVARISAGAHAEITNHVQDQVTFSMHDIASGTVRTVGTRDILSTLTASMLGDLDLDVRLLGLPLGGLLAAVTAIARAALAPLAGLIDPVVATLLDLLGIGVGEADVRVHGVRCNGAALVG